MNRWGRSISLLGMIFFLMLVVQCSQTNSSSKEGGQESVPPIILLEGSTMGTTYNIKFVLISTTVGSAGVQQEMKDGIDALLESVNLQMSTYVPDSELSRFNRFEGTDWFEVSADTAMVFAESQRVSQLSGGAFDITVGPLVNLWGFGPTKNRGAVPSAQELLDVKDIIGYGKISVQVSPPAIKKEKPRMYCDLSAIAKGFGVDKVSMYLESKGYANYMVEIGGEVRTAGKKPGNKSWRVAIATPDGSSSYQKVLELDDLSMATSGDYHNYFEKDGIRYSHTMDPNTMKPIVHNLASVSVVHKSCMTADAMATALDVLGPEKGFDLAIQEHLAVFMIVHQKGKFVEKMTPEFTKLLGETK